VVIYVGKAKSLRRRLQNYRNATRRRVHRKMRVLVRDGHSIQIEELPSEEAALLRENELIQELSPIHNVDGAYAFLYPALGVGHANKLTLLCFSTSPESYVGQNLQWFGTFRSRPRVKLAFDSLLELLSLIGHREKSARLPAHEHVRGSRFVGFRQIPDEIAEALPWFLSGEDLTLLQAIAHHLLVKPRALREASLVQERLTALKAFFEQDARRLRTALRKLGKPGSYIDKVERDALFIRASFEGVTGDVALLSSQD
jgi:GIY-YIG catalytic domain